MVSYQRKKHKIDMLEVNLYCITLLAATAQPAFTQAIFVCDF